MLCTADCQVQSDLMQAQHNERKKDGTWGAVMPARMVHARVSFGPAVKYVRRPSCVYVAAMRLQTNQAEAQSAARRVCRLKMHGGWRCKFDLRGASTQRRSASTSHSHLHAAATTES